MNKGKYVSASEAVCVVKSRDRVFIHGSAATPLTLIKALQARHDELTGVELVSITTLGELDLLNPAYRNSFFLTRCSCRRLRARPPTVTMGIMYRYS